MVAHRLLAANNYPPTQRTLRAVSPYYSRYVNRRKELVLFEKPDVVRHLGSLSKKVLKQYQTSLKRGQTPLRGDPSSTRGRWNPAA